MDALLTLTHWPANAAILASFASGLLAGTALAYLRKEPTKAKMPHPRG